MRLTGASSHSNSSSAIRAAISAPYPHERLSSWTTRALPVFFTLRTMAGQSYGARVRRSRTSAWMPSASACRAAASARWTSAPKVTTVTSPPSRGTDARPNGIM